MSRGRRLVSLDAFRGLTIAAMIVVNNPASESRYRFLRHAVWDGCHFADLIFPAFLFIAGVSITLSFSARRRAGATQAGLLLNVLRRSALIFALGLLLNALPYFDWEIVRAMGILQRIALAYLGASLIALHCGPRGQAVWAAGLLLLHAILLTCVPVPGHGAGVLEPGSDLGAWIDRLVLAGHLAHHEWDPEGLLGTFPAVASVIAGALAGHWIERAPSPDRVASGLALGGVATLLLGLLWAHWLPLNKSLWTASYTLFTGGASAIAFAACFWLVDVRGVQGWTAPFLVFGTNPILAYWSSSFAAKMLELFHRTRADGRSIFLETYLVDCLHSLGGPRALAALLYSLLYAALWLLLLLPLYRRGIFVKI